MIGGIFFFFQLSDQLATIEIELPVVVILMDPTMQLAVTDSAISME